MNIIAGLGLSLVTSLRSLRHSLRTRSKGRASEAIFGEIYDTNYWGSAHSVSGPGSEERETEDIRRLLPDLLQRHSIKSILDIPCGDFSWMSKIEIGPCTYIGAEVVRSLVDDNVERHSRPGREFIFADITKDPLPKVDLVMCRDCLIHLSFNDAKLALKNIRQSGAKYLLATTDTSVKANRPIKTGEYRSLNLQLPPISMGAPLEIHRDRYEPRPGEQLIDPNKQVALFKL